MVKGWDGVLGDSGFEFQWEQKKKKMNLPNQKKKFYGFYGGAKMMFKSLLWIHSMLVFSLNTKWISRMLEIIMCHGG